MSAVTAKHVTPAGVNAQVASSCDLTSLLLTSIYIQWFITVQTSISPWAFTPTRLLISNTVRYFKMQSIAIYKTFKWYSVAR